MNKLLPNDYDFSRKDNECDPGNCPYIMLTTQPTPEPFLANQNKRVKQC